MKKFLLFNILFFCSTITSAKADISESNSHSFSEKGIQYLPYDEINLPIDIKQNMKFSQETYTNGKGYIDKKNPAIQRLLTLNKRAAEEIKLYKNNIHPMDTHLKSSLSDISLSFPFREINSIDQSQIIGFMPIGGYDQREESKGWSGMIEYFNDKKLGICHFDYQKIISVQLSKEYTEYFINKKPSTKIIEGNIEDGFLYTINWFTNDSMRVLECANKKFDRTIMREMITLANNIDKEIIILP